MRELRYFLLDRDLSGDPEGRDHPARDPTAAHTLDDVNYTIARSSRCAFKLEGGIYAQMPIPVRADEGFKVHTGPFEGDLR